MSTAAVITLVLASLLVVGGLVLSVASAVRAERAERRQRRSDSPDQPPLGR